MKATVISAGDLSADHVAAWAALQRGAGGIDSPFFRPEFTQAVAQVRSDVEVAILEDGGCPVGFFPFQRGAGNFGRPVAGHLSDFHGVVLDPSAGLDPQWMVRQCGLSAWHFDHLPCAQESFRPFHWTQSASPFIDLSGGYDAYLEQRRNQRAADVMQAVNKKKKAERQLGPVRLVLRTTDRLVLEKLVEWKSQQYRRTQKPNVFSFPWILALVERLLQMPEESDFSGLLSALYIGDRLAAAHFGMRTRNVVHWWFPAYDPELGKYSPGSQLLLQFISVAAAGGVERIDLGKGQEAYKRDFMTGAIPLAEGSIDCRAVRRVVRRAWHHALIWTYESRLRKPAMVPWRFIRRMRDRAQFQ